MSHDDDASLNHYWSLIATGFTFGLVHVLAGPDHLSALAALSVGSSWKAFSLGFRWGVGHSLGLVVVAIIFISLKGEFDLEKVGRYCDVLVGVFMIMLGMYGTYGALKMYWQKRDKRDPDLHISSCKLCSFGQQRDTRGDTRATSIEMRDSSSQEFLIEKHDSYMSQLDDNVENSSCKEQRKEHHDLSWLNPTASSHASLQHDEHNHSHGHDHGHCNHDHDHGHGHDPSHDCSWLSWCPFIDMHDPYTQRILSFVIGCIHGVAGPGGILGKL